MRSDTRDLRDTATFSVDGHVHCINTKARNQFGTVEIREGTKLTIPESLFIPQRQVEIVNLYQKSNEFLLIYCDGVTEAQNEAGNFFGEQRLWQLLPRFSRLNVEDIGLSLLNEISNFTRDARQSDDISLVVIRLKNNSTG